MLKKCVCLFFVLLTVKLFVGLIIQSLNCSAHFAWTPNHAGLTAMKMSEQDKTGVPEPPDFTVHSAILQQLVNPVSKALIKNNIVLS